MISDRLFQARETLVLNYHGFSDRAGDYRFDSDEEVYVITSKTFQRHLEILDEQGRGDTCKSAVKEPVDKDALLTFDDGLICQYDIACPLLDQFNRKGVFFISTGRIGHYGLMGKSEIQALVKRGFSIGSHGHEHEPLSAYSPQKLADELMKSRLMLEDITGEKITDFSVPRGFYNAEIKKAAIAVGFEKIFTSRFDLVCPQTGTSDIPRVAVKKTTSEVHYSEWVEGKLGLRRYSEKVKNRLRSTLPSPIYDLAAWVKNKVVRA